MLEQLSNISYHDMLEALDGTVLHKNVTPRAAKCPDGQN
jgi:hypothetical protein